MNLLVNDFCSSRKFSNPGKWSIYRALKYIEELNDESSDDETDDDEYEDDDDESGDGNESGDDDVSDDDEYGDDDCKVEFVMNI